MSDISEKIDKLTPEELDRVNKLISKFADRHDNNSFNPPNKRKGPKKVRHVDVTDADATPNHGPGRDRPRQRIILDENDIDDAPATTRRNRGSSRSRRNEPRKPPRRGAGGGKIQARTEPVRLSRENKFEKMRERNAAKEDSKIDRLLWKDREPLERPEEFEYVEAQCEVCGKWFDVHPSLLYKDADTGEVKFTCDRCVRRG